MSVQVSYKKQFVLGFILIIIFLAVVELVVNVWLYNFYRCEFEDNEIFKNADPEINRKLCLENLGYDVIKTRLVKAEGFAGTDENPLDRSLINWNSEGFRSPEFEKEKPENTYRIFNIGGSTTFGIGVINNQTFPFYLQQFFDQSNVGLKVEVINAGVVGSWSLAETKLVKERLLNFQPDLFIVYDGWNDNRKVAKDTGLASATLWKERWIEICTLGKQYGFDTIIILQPMVSTGKKILTKQEQEYYIHDNNAGGTEDYPQYVKQLDELNDHCSASADFSGIFDYISEPIYFDRGHTGPYGNQIIAKEVYQLSLPIILKHENRNYNEDYEEVSFEGIDQRLILNDFELFTKDFYIILNDVVSPYKTPRVFSLIFEY